MLATDRLTTAEFIKITSQLDDHFELHNGVLVKMPPESRGNERIALRLLRLLWQYFSENQLSNNQVEVEIEPGIIRRPDLLVIPSETDQLLESLSRPLITRDMKAPLIAVEVVSPGKANHERDYEQKRLEYEDFGIEEYWLIDPEQQTATILQLEHGEQYQSAITSSLVPDVDIAVLLKLMV